MADAPRSCFRKVGGVLVERIVGEVIPELQTNLAGIKRVLEAFMQKRKALEEQISNTRALGQQMEMELRMMRQQQQMSATA